MNNSELLQKLQTLYKNCTKCPLSTQGRTQVVFGTGNPKASLMFVGEGPGRNEDIQGKPFVGRAGQLLTEAIKSLGLNREDVWISNVVKCRPPKNRAPLPEEIKTCTNILLFQEIAIIKPKIICTLGATAIQAFLGPTTKISNVRGTIQKYNDFLIMPTYHPAYLLRNPSEKKTVWQDLQKVMKHI